MEGPLQDRPAQPVTPAPPQETAPKSPKFCLTSGLRSAALHFRQEPPSNLRAPHFRALTGRGTPTGNEPQIEPLGWTRTGEEVGCPARDPAPIHHAWESESGLAQRALGKEPRPEAGASRGGRVRRSGHAPLSTAPIRSRPGPMKVRNHRLKPLLQKREQMSGRFSCQFGINSKVRTVSRRYGRGLGRTRETESEYPSPGGHQLSVGGRGQLHLYFGFRGHKMHRPYMHPKGRGERRKWEEERKKGSFLIYKMEMVIHGVVKRNRSNNPCETAL
ncbi:uncharacterized protein LOC144368562 [Ictidomys tridecemlineatus]